MQKKLSALTLAFLLALSLAVNAFAVTPYYNSTVNCDSPKLSFSGTTVSCSINVRASSGSDISVILTLYKVVGSGVEYVTSWDLSGTTSLNVSRTASVTRGQEYLLAADVSVDGPGGHDSIYKTTRGTC